jgi:hypothetical protein
MPGGRKFTKAPEGVDKAEAPKAKAKVGNGGRKAIKAAPAEKGKVGMGRIRG